MNLNLRNAAAVSRILREAPEKGDDFYWDTELSGYGLRVRNRRPTYLVQYRVQGGRQGRKKIGDARKIRDPAARAAARKLLAKIELGADPRAEEKAKQAAAAHTLLSIAGLYIKAKESELRGNSIKLKKLYLLAGNYLRPLHGMPAAQITPADVAVRLRAITQQHGGNTASAVRTHLSALFVWAAREGMLGSAPNNPCAMTNRPAISPPRDRVLADDELARIWHGCADDDFGKIVRLLILLGQRRGEIGGLRWSEVDFERRLLSLPASRVKNKTAHTLPLPDAALDIIRSVPRRIGREAMFGGVRRDALCVGFASWGAKSQLDARAGIPAWALHDVRRSFATGLANLGIQPHIIEEILNHRTGHRGGIAAIYNKSTYAAEVRAALERWAEHVAEVVGRPRLWKTAEGR
jgi:integrase